LPSFDHLVAVPVHLTGKVLSVKPLREGQSFVICDDSGINIGNRRRWVGHSQEVTPVGSELKPGTRVRFLPGTPTRQGRMPRAYQISIIRQGSRMKPAFPRFIANFRCPNPVGFEPLKSYPSRVKDTLLALWRLAQWQKINTPFVALEGSCCLTQFGTRLEKQSNGYGSIVLC